MSTVDLVALPYPEPPYESPPLPPPKGEQHGRRGRRYYNLIAAKHPLSAIAGLTYGNAEEARLGFPEKHVAGRVSIHGREIDIHCTHLPPGVSNGLLKVHHFEAVHRRVMRDRTRPRILCGDFNAPVEENEAEPEFEIDGGWSDPWSREDKLRWREAEWSILKNEGMRDAYRATHKAETPLARLALHGPHTAPLRPHLCFAGVRDHGLQIPDRLARSWNERPRGS